MLPLPSPLQHPAKRTAVRYLIYVTLLAGSAAWIAAVARSQEAHTGDGQEGGQQTGYQNMTPGERAAATRAFLGLGTVPDKAAAARGAPLFIANCAVCHGQTARGAMGPSLITSDLVLADDHGEHLTPFLEKGRPEKGMPGFANMSAEQLTDIAEFLHLQVEDVANRGAYRVLNILVGDAAKGRAYVQGHCMSCHTAETFAHMATKFRSPEQLQRSWIWPAWAANMVANVTLAAGAVAGRVTQISDFRITLVDESGQAHTVDLIPGVEVQINDRLAAHQELVMGVTNDDMHNVTAYLETLP